MRVRNDSYERGIDMALLHGQGKGKGLEVEYAGIDLIERSLSYEFEVTRKPIEVLDSFQTRRYVAGIREWSFRLRSLDRNMPSNGEVKLVGIAPGPADDFHAVGTAFIDASFLKEDLHFQYDVDIWEHLLKPLSASLVYPAEEQRRKGEQTAKEKARLELAARAKEKLEAWKDVSGVWEIQGSRYHCPYSETHDSLTEALASAEAGSEWNEFYTKSISCDGKQIFDHDEFLALI